MFFEYANQEWNDVVFSCPRTMWSNNQVIAMYVKWNCIDLRHIELQKSLKLNFLDKTEWTAQIDFLDSRQSLNHAQH